MCRAAGARLPRAGSDGQRMETLRRRLLIIAPALLFYLALAAPISLAGLSLVGRPFAGFFLFHPLIVSAYQPPSAPKVIRFNDALTAVDGVPVLTIRGFFKRISEKKVGTVVTYDFIRPGLRDVTQPEAYSRGRAIRRRLPIVRFTFSDLEGTFGRFLAFSLLWLLAGLFVVWKRPGEPAAIVFFVLCLVEAAQDLTYSDLVLTSLFPRLDWLLYGVRPLLYVELATFLPRRPATSRRQLAVIRAVPIVVVSLYLLYFLVLHFSNGGIEAQGFSATRNFMEMTAFFQPALSIAMVVFAASCGRFLFSRDPILRGQSSVMFLGVLFSYGPAILWRSLRMIHLTPPFSSDVALYAFALFPLFIGYAVLRTRLFGIDIIVKRTTTYVLLLGLVFLLYFLVGSSASALPSLLGLPRWAVDGTIALSIVPMHAGIKRLVDRVMFRTPYNQATAMQRFNTEAAAVPEAGQIVRKFIALLEELLHPEAIAILLKDERGLEIFDSLGLPPGATFVLPLEHPALHGQAEPATIGPVTEATAIALHAGGSVTGAVVLGPRKSQQPYVEADRELVRGMGQQMEILLQMARQTSLLIAKREDEARIEAELAGAREIQQGLLPSALPVVPGLDLSGEMRPSMAVGGDFFDAFVLDENRIGIVLGDVSGHGVQGAMVMTMAKTIFGSIDKCALAPEEVIAQANRMFSQVRPNGRTFLAACYAVYDRQDRSLSIANAGLPLPISASGQLGEPGFVLGVLTDATYTASTVALESGEAVLFFTDGIAEACNAAGEAFGEDRVQHLLRQESGSAADTIRASLFDELAVFCGLGAERDDRTVVVVRAYQ